MRRRYSTTNSTRQTWSPLTRHRRVDRILIEIIGISTCRLAAKIEAVAPLLVGDVLGVLALALNAYLALQYPTRGRSERTSMSCEPD